MASDKMEMAETNLSNTRKIQILESNLGKANRQVTALQQELKDFRADKAIIKYEQAIQVGAEMQDDETQTLANRSAPIVHRSEHSFSSAPAKIVVAAATQTDDMVELKPLIPVVTITTKTPVDQMK